MTDLMTHAADLAKAQAFFGLPVEELERQEQLRQIAARREAFAQFLVVEARRMNHKLSPLAQFDDCARWLAQCQCYGLGCHPKIDAFIEAEGGELAGWGQVWAVFGSVMQAAHVERENLLDRR